LQNSGCSKDAIYGGIAVDICDYSNDQISAVIDNWIKNSVYRDALKMRFVDGRTIAYIAERLQMSDRQINRIVLDGKKTILKKLAD
jgi:Sigma-70, region 4.